MAHPSKRKGAGFEIEVLRRLQACGLVAEKMPLSGALPNYCGDIAASIRAVSLRSSNASGAVEHSERSTASWGKATRLSSVTITPIRWSSCGSTTSPIYQNERAAIRYSTGQPT